MQNLQSRIEGIYKSISLSGQDWRFEWHEPYIERLNIFFTKLLREYSSIFEGDSVGTIYRLGLIANRIAAILSFVRKFDDPDVFAVGEVRNVSNPVHCTEEDFECTISLIELFVVHIFRCFEYLKSEDTFEPKPLEKDAQMKYYKALPEKFKRSDAMGTAKEIGIPERTADSYLKKFVDNKLLIGDGAGRYEKITKKS